MIGQRDQFLGKVTEKYGIAKEEAEKKLKELEERSKQRQSEQRDRAA